MTPARWVVSALFSLQMGSETASAMPPATQVNRAAARSGTDGKPWWTKIAARQIFRSPERTIMKEIIDLQARVVAHAPSLAEGTCLDFSRTETGGDFTLLSPELRAEIEDLRQALGTAIPEDFDYNVFLGGDEGPLFGLEYERIPTGPEGDWNPEEPLLDQLGPFNWEAARQGARSSGQTMRKIAAMLDILKLKPQSAKGLQRVYRQAAKEFVREKRRDTEKIHVLYRNKEEELMEVDFEDGEAFREMLPGMISRGEDVFGVVVHGKPLPVERIDALTAQAHRTFQARMREASANRAKGGEVSLPPGDEEQPGYTAFQIS